MPAAAPATELVPFPTSGRRFLTETAVQLADADPKGRFRLDAIARHLQDVANDDAIDAGLGNAFGWVVRRTLIEVATPGRLGERLRLTTFCSGTGRSWAERRTSIAGSRGAAIEACSLWVRVDVETGRPAALDGQFYRAYGEAAAERRVSTRLSLPGPPDAVETRPWAVRSVDLDVFGHVNNAAQWAILEEALAGTGGDRVGVAEMEHLRPVDAAEEGIALHVAGTRPRSAWLIVDGRVRSAARWTSLGPADAAIVAPAQ